MCLVIRPGKYHSGSNPRNAPPAQRINSAYWSRWSHSTAPPGSAHASLVHQCMHSTLAALSGAPIVIKGSRVPPLLFGAIVGPCHRFTAPPLPDLAAAFLAQPSPDIDAADVVRCLNWQTLPPLTGWGGVGQARESAQQGGGQIGADVQSNPRNAPPAQSINSAYWSRWSHSTAPPGSAHASLVHQCMHSTLAALSGAPIVIKGSRVPPLLFGAIVGPCHRFTAPPLPDLAAAFLAQPSPDIDAADVVRCLNWQTLPPLTGWGGVGQARESAQQGGGK